MPGLGEKAKEQLGQYIAAHEASVRYRVRTLAQMVRDRLVNSKWLALASVVVNGAKTHVEQLSKLYDYAKATIRKQRDPYGYDVFYTPEVTLIQRFGDCDEYTSLIALLAKSLGYPVIIRAVSMDGYRYSHVYPLADAAKGRGEPRWVALDGVFGRGPGTEPAHEKEMDVRV